MNKLLSLLIILFVVLPLNVIQSISILLLGMRGYKFNEKTRTFKKIN